MKLYQLEHFAVNAIKITNYVSVVCTAQEIFFISLYCFQSMCLVTATHGFNHKDAGTLMYYTWSNLRIEMKS